MNATIQCLQNLGFPALSRENFGIQSWFSGKYAQTHLVASHNRVHVVKSDGFLVLLTIANNRRGADPHACWKSPSNLASVFISNNPAADSVHNRNGIRKCRPLLPGSSWPGQFRPWHKTSKTGPKSVPSWTLSPHRAQLVCGQVGPRFFVEKSSLLSSHSSFLISSGRGSENTSCGWCSL